MYTAAGFDGTSRASANVMIESPRRTAAEPARRRRMNRFTASSGTEAEDRRAGILAGPGSWQGRGSAGWVHRVEELGERVVEVVLEPGDPLRDGRHEPGVVEEDAGRLVDEQLHRVDVLGLGLVALRGRQADGVVDQLVVVGVLPVREVEERLVAAVEHRPQVVRAGVAVRR